MEFKKDKLVVKRYDTREEMGACAAAEAEKVITQIIAKKGQINMIFAAAPSQNEMLASLLNSQIIDWSKVNALHMDEYVGLPEGDSHTFGAYLYEHIFRHKNFKSIHYIGGGDPEAVCARYTKILEEYPVDVVCLGIGENGHIAFNDPWVADFHDPKPVKIVELDGMCRQQQVNDGCFPTLNDVPKQAMSLTMSFIMSVPNAICVVPTDRKANAVYGATRGPVTTACPASILRQHKNAGLYLDKAAASKIL